MNLQDNITISGYIAVSDIAENHIEPRYSDIKPEFLCFRREKIVSIMEIHKAASKIFRTAFTCIYDIAGCYTVLVSEIVDSFQEILADAH